jgi:hypothetical protein
MYIPACMPIHTTYTPVSMHVHLQWFMCKQTLTHANAPIAAHMYDHTHMPYNLHARTHMYTCRQSHTHTLADMHTHLRHVPLPLSTCMQTVLYDHTYAHTRTPYNMHTRSLTCPQIHMYAYMHTKHMHALKKDDIGLDVKVTIS